MGPEGCSGVSVEMSEMRVEQNSGTFLVHRRKTGAGKIGDVSDEVLDEFKVFFEDDCELS